MKLTIRDIVTGNEVVVEDGGNPSWWADGNGSCDCNRAIHFPDVDEELDAAMRRDHPDLLPPVGICYGYARFLIVAADTAEFTLDELNGSYDERLRLSAHKP